MMYEHAGGGSSCGVQLLDVMMFHLHGVQTQPVRDVIKKPSQLCEDAILKCNDPNSF